MSAEILSVLSLLSLLQLVDDSLNEATEQFEVQLVSTSFGSRLGPISKATILIDGPNDGELLLLGSNCL